MGVLDLLLFGLERFDIYSILISNRQIDRANPIKVTEIELLRIALDFDPFPPLPSYLCGYSFEFFGYEAIELRGVGQIPFVLLFEQIPLYESTRIDIDVDTDKP